MNEKDARDPKFLNKVKRYALDHKDLAIPEKDSELYASQMWTLGVLMALKSEGYKISKDKKC